MLARLIKHEFIATSRVVPLVYGATIAMFLTNLLMRRFELKWLSGLLLVLLALLAIAQIIVTYVVVFLRYYKNFYDGEGYLMHTLPVLPRQLLTSKVIVTFIWLLISYLIMVGVVTSIAIQVAGGSITSLTSLLNDMQQQLGIHDQALSALISGLGLYLILSILYLVAQVFFAISLGNLARFHKLGLAAPILFYIGINFVLQLLVLAAMLFLPFGIAVIDGVFRLVPRGMVSIIIDPNQDGVFGLGSILVIVLATAGLLAGTARLLARHLSLR
jgi:hypothetical protein